MSAFVKRLSPYLIFAVLIFFFMPDVFLSGKVFIAKMGDPHLATYSLAFYFREMVTSGIFPLWNPLSFCGYPYDADATSVVNLLNLLVLLFHDINLAWNIGMISNIFCAASFTYLYMRKMSFSSFACLVSSIIFAFAPSSGCYVDSWGFFLPLILWLIEEHFSSKHSRYLVFCFLSLAALFLTAVPQYSLYIAAFFACYTLCRFRSMLGVLIVAFSFGAVSFHTFRLFEALQHSPRGSLWFVNVLLPIHLVNMIYPFLFESPFRSETNFFFSKLFYELMRFLFRTDQIQYVMPPYVTVIGFTFFFFSWRQKGIARFYLTAVLILLLYMITFPILFPIYKHVPILAQLPRLARLGVILTFSLAILAGVGANRFTKEQIHSKPVIWFYFLLSSVVAGSLLLIRWFANLNQEVIKKFLIDYAKEHMVGTSHYAAPFVFYLRRIDEFFIFVNQWTALQSPSILFSAAFIGLSILLLYLRERGRIAKNLFCSVCIFLLSADLLAFARITEYRMSSPADLKVPSDAISFLQNDAGIFRIMPILTPAEYGKGRARDILAPNANLLYGLSSVEGWNPFLPKWYQAFFHNVQSQSDPDPAMIMGGAEGNFDYRAMNFLNVKYFIARESVRLKREMPVVFEDGTHKVYLNHASFDRAFIVYDYVVMRDQNQILEYLRSKEMDFARTVVLEQNPTRVPSGLHKGKLGATKVVIKKYTPNFVEMDVAVPQNGFLVFTDNYYPGWKAMVDGTVTKIFKANFAFRAVEIPQGNHRVQFYYRPESLRNGAAASLVSLTLSAAFLLLRRRVSPYAS